MKHGQTITVTHLSFLEEGDTALAVSNIHQRIQNDESFPLSSLSLNFGRSPHRHWIVFTAESNKTQDVVLELSNPFIYHLELYDSAGKRLCQTGAAFRFAQRPLLHRRFAIPLSLHSGQNTFYLMADRRDELLRFTMDFYSKEEFVNHRASEAVFFGGLFGILLFIAVFSLAL
ncbi:MAG TPA: 7TM-DISM domain-containing protein, partial [Flavisolibacter sp.]|nr:7TM-DISM domain-containing protein [Flavisolibacter sp.]